MDESSHLLPDLPPSAVDQEYQLRLRLHELDELYACDPEACLQTMEDYFSPSATSEPLLRPKTSSDLAFDYLRKAVRIADDEILSYANFELPSSERDKVVHLLRQALSLDETCFDARRMYAFASSEANFDEHYEFLEQHSAQVLKSCKDLISRARLEFSTLPTYPEKLLELKCQLALKPYLRWQAALASLALICGRYTRCLEVFDETCKVDPNDSEHIAYTAFLAAAKLEDISSYVKLRTKYYHRKNPWGQVCDLYFSYKRETELNGSIIESCENDLIVLDSLVDKVKGEENGTSEENDNGEGKPEHKPTVDVLKPQSFETQVPEPDPTSLAPPKNGPFQCSGDTFIDLVNCYPFSGFILVHQANLPESLFARRAAKRFSSWELFYALSEASVLLQEGCTSVYEGSFGLWLKNRAAYIPAHFLVNPDDMPSFLRLSLGIEQSFGSKDPGGGVPPSEPNHRPNADDDPHSR